MNDVKKKVIDYGTAVAAVVLVALLGIVAIGLVIICMGLAMIVATASPHDLVKIGSVVAGAGIVVLVLIMAWAKKLGAKKKGDADADG